MPETIDLINTIGSTNSTPQAIDTYDCLLASLVQALSRPYRSSSHNRANSWFDSDCWLAKKQVRSLFHSIRAYPSPNALKIYFEARRSCTTLLDMKQHLHAQRKWTNLLQAILSRNFKVFWSLVSRTNLSYALSPYSPIPSDSWVTHFSKIFSSSCSPHYSINPSQNFPDWPPVTSDEVLELISTLKPGKSPGPDHVISEILSNNPLWWSHLLAKLFTIVNHSGVFPDSWLSSILIPIFKKGDPSLPSNYRPISLLSHIGKLYSKFLLSKLSAWASSKNLPGKEQIGFRSEASTLDHVLLLYHLAEKYSIYHKARLFAAFVDLRGAFDSVNRNLLWDKLNNWGIEPRLLFLLRRLHSSNICQIRLPNSYELSDKLLVDKGVRQGCVLAPLLFNLFLADLPSSLSASTNAAPSLNGSPISVLLYADDAVLLSLTKAGLRRTLSKFQTFCSANDLVINADKTKIINFSNSVSLSPWTIGAQTFQQVLSFKYLGITLHHKLSWRPHKKLVLSSSSLHLNAISKFHYSSGNQFVPAALLIFRTKLLSHLLYGAPIWIEAIDHDVDTLAAAFFRKILGVPNMIRLSTLVLELGTHLPSTLAWSTTFKYWLRLHLNSKPNSLLYDLLRDNFLSKWLKLIEIKLQSLDLNLESLNDLGIQQAHALIKSKLWQHEFEVLAAKLNPTCSPLSFGLSPSLGYHPNYFSSLINPRLRRAFMLARFNIFPSANHTGRFANIPKEDRLCLFCHLVPDTLDHILFFCSVHFSIRKALLEPWLSSLPNTPEIFLNDSSSRITEAVAIFLLEILKLTFKL